MHFYTYSIFPWSWCVCNLGVFFPQFGLLHTQKFKWTKVDQELQEFVFYRTDLNCKNKNSFEDANVHMLNSGPTAFLRDNSHLGLNTSPPCGLRNEEKKNQKKTTHTEKLTTGQ